MIKNKWLKFKYGKPFMRFGQYVEILMRVNGLEIENIEELDGKSLTTIVDNSEYGKLVYRGYIVSLDFVRTREIYGRHPGRPDNQKLGEFRIALDVLSRSQFDILRPSELQDNRSLDNSSILSYNDVGVLNAIIRFRDGVGLIDKQDKEAHAKLVEGAVHKIKDKLKMTKLKAIETTTLRSKGETYFSFEIAPEVEEYFKELANGKVLNPTNWQEISIYDCPTLVESAYYKDKLNEHHLFDQIGGELIDRESRKMNISWLRTAGGKGRIKQEDTMPLGTLQSYTQDILNFIKEYLQDTFTEVRIVGTATVEVK